MAVREFYIGDTVQIDDRGYGEVAEHLENGALLVNIVGIDYQAEFSPRRLTKTMTTQQGQYNSATPTVTVDEAESSSGAEQPRPRQDVPAQAPGPSRFVPVTERDVTDVINAQNNQNTTKKTLYDMKLLRQFLSQPGVEEVREIYNIAPAELSPLLCKFFISVRKANGEQYEPASLRSMMSSFDRYLKRHNYLYPLATSMEFYTLRETIKSKQKELKKIGKGNLPHRAEPASDEEIDKLWEAGQFGTSSPNSIINTLWFYSSVNFGLRGSTEHRNMCWGDVKLSTDGSGREYLEFNERQTKTRTGENPRDIRQVKPKMWAVPSNRDRCPVEVFKRYRELRPSDFSRDDDPFYIATNTCEGTPPLGARWFRRQPIGVNKISSLMKNMVQSANLSEGKRLTNHSARKHLIQKLSDNNIPPTQIMQISGHKNIQSVNAYSSISEQQHRRISEILSNTSISSVSTSPSSSTTPPSSSLVPPASTSSQLQTFDLTHSQSVTKSAHSSSVSSMFAGNISGGVFNIHVHHHHAVNPTSPPKKRSRIFVIDSSQSDDEMNM